MHHRRPFSAPPAHAPASRPRARMFAPKTALALSGTRFNIYSPVDTKPISQENPVFPLLPNAARKSRRINRIPPFSVHVPSNPVSPFPLRHPPSRTCQVRHDRSAHDQKQGKPVLFTTDNSQLTTDRPKTNPTKTKAEPLGATETAISTPPPLTQNDRTNPIRTSFVPTPISSNIKTNATQCDEMRQNPLSPLQLIMQHAIRNPNPPNRLPPNDLHFIHVPFCPEMSHIPLSVLSFSRHRWPGLPPICVLRGRYLPLSILRFFSLLNRLPSPASLLP